MRLVEFTTVTDFATGATEPVYINPERVTRVGLAWTTMDAMEMTEIHFQGSTALVLGRPADVAACLASTVTIFAACPTRAAKEPS